MSDFPDLLNIDQEGGGENFWPSLTDIMMVIVMIFLISTATLIIRNWSLVKDLTDATNDRWDDPGVTRQATYCGRGERDAVGGLTAPRPGDLASEHVVVDNHLEVDLGRPR